MNYCTEALFLLRTFKGQHSNEGQWYIQNILQKKHASVIVSLFTEINAYSHASAIQDRNAKISAIADISKLFYDIENKNIPKFSLTAASRDNNKIIGLAQTSYPDMPLEVLSLIFIHRAYSAAILVSSDKVKRYLHQTTLRPNIDFIEF